MSILSGSHWAGQLFLLIQISLPWSQAQFVFLRGVNVGGSLNDPMTTGNWGIPISDSLYAIAAFTFLAAGIFKIKLAR